MKKPFFVLSLIMCAVGLFLVYATFNPLGFVLDGIGFLIFVYSIYPNRREQRVFLDSVKYKKSVYEEEYKCGNCRMFGNEGCPRSEELINAKPCEKFIGTVFKE